MRATWSDRNADDATGAAALAAAIGCVYLVQRIAPAAPIWSSLALTPRAVCEDWEIWRLFTYLWLHSTESLWHVGLNTLALWVFGKDVAVAWGTWRFVRFYALCGIGAGLAVIGWPLALAAAGIPSLSYDAATIGASGAVMGVIVAYSLSWPDRTIVLAFPPIPVRALYVAPVMLAVQVAFGPREISHAAHVGGIVTALFLLWRRGDLRFPRGRT